MSNISKKDKIEIGEWEDSKRDSFWAFLYVAGSYDVSVEACKEKCFPTGLCVTVEKVKYIFGCGSENGVRIGFVDYPKYPEEKDIILEKAISVGKFVAEKNFQTSFLIVSPNGNQWFSRRSN